MAEYIEKQQMAFKMANVIEYSEYEKLKAKNTELKIKYDNAMDLFCLAKEEKIKLRSKIDKAKSNIELMLEQEKQKDGTYTEVGQGIAIALGLLNNEIGE